ncbi:hypothetical protein [Sphaerochaeta sp.]|uniref:hypothetical protein n=1 Tax=Sphaerochaeta sp. TaxID=1972642 RepID=UPI003D0A71BC
MKNERYYARICWNSKGWQHPTWESCLTETTNTYAHIHRYGHEEWLFNKEMQVTDEVDGEIYQYGFIQPLSAECHIGKSLHVLLWTLDNNKKKLVVAEVDEIEVLTEVHRKIIHKKYGKKFYELMKNDLLSSSIDTSDLDGLYENMYLVNVRFKLSALNIYNKPKTIPSDSAVHRNLRYKLISDNLIAERNNNTNQKNKKMGCEEEILRRGKEFVKVRREHNKIQNELIYLFTSQGIDAEKEVSHVDIVATNKNGDLTFYEIKVCDSAHKCIREALGQLIAYYYRAIKKPTKLVIVGNCKSKNDDIKFIESIRNMTKLNVYYCAWINEKLTKEI